MSKANSSLLERCIVCGTTNQHLLYRKMEIRLHPDETPTPVLICQYCYTEACGSPLKENTDAKKER